MNKVMIPMFCLVIDKTKIKILFKLC